MIVCDGRCSNASTAIDHVVQFFLLLLIQPWIHVSDEPTVGQLIIIAVWQNCWVLELRLLGIRIYILLKYVQCINDLLGIKVYCYNKFSATVIGSLSVDGLQTPQNH